MGTQELVPPGGITKMSFPFIKKVATLHDLRHGHGLGFRGR